MHAYPTGARPRRKRDLFAKWESPSERSLAVPFRAAFPFLTLRALVAFGRLVVLRTLVAFRAVPMGSRGAKSKDAARGDGRKASDQFQTRAMVNSFLRSTTP